MTNISLPPDPEGMNDRRSALADEALAVFMRATGSDLEDAVSDLIADLGHWCDRHEIAFAVELDRARFHYKAETFGDDGPGQKLPPACHNAVLQLTDSVLDNSPPPIVIEVRGGVVEDVLNVPAGLDYEIRDYDNLDALTETDGPPMQADEQELL